MAKVYSVKEMFKTLQGEGAQAGRAAVFCRFAGCNLWSGREQDRATAVCKFCDTDFVGTDGVNGGKFDSPDALADRILSCWLDGLVVNSLASDAASESRRQARRYVVFTGGEPMLQLDEPLIAALHARGFEVALETNGTLPVPETVEWVCVSPKQGSELVQKRGSELKVVVPQAGQDLEWLASLDFEYFFVQAMDDADPLKKKSAMEFAIGCCLKDPRWRLSVQTHKVIGMP